jgi:hypothetical protein
MPILLPLDKIKLDFLLFYDKICPNTTAVYRGLIRVQKKAHLKNIILLDLLGYTGDRHPVVF